MSELTWFGWFVFGAYLLWVACFCFALPFFLIAETRNNWAHGNTGLSGHIRTLFRLPLLFTAAPMYLVMVVAWAFG